MFFICEVKGDSKGVDGKSVSKSARGLAQSQACGAGRAPLRNGALGVLHAILPGHVAFRRIILAQGGRGYSTAVPFRAPQSFRRAGCLCHPGGTRPVDAESKGVHINSPLLAYGRVFLRGEGWKIQIPKTKLQRISNLQSEVCASRWFGHVKDGTRGRAARCRPPRQAGRPPLRTLKSFDDGAILP